MALVEAAAREEHQVGKYRVTLFRDAEGRIIGALVEGPRLPRPVYIAYSEAVRHRLPKTIKKFLRRFGFRVE